jgi:hypothetical protein
MAFCAYLLQIEYTQICQKTGEARVEIHLRLQVQYVIAPVFTKLALVRQLFCKELLHCHFMEIRQTVYSPILDHRHPAGHVITCVPPPRRTERLITGAATTTTALADHDVRVYNCTFHCTVLHNILVPITLLNCTCVGWLPCKHLLQTSCSFERQWA